jgi:signal transduction histidine kinase/DNA-binding NarL/FixJ family response regulator
MAENRQPERIPSSNVIRAAAGWNHIDLRGRKMLHPPWEEAPSSRIKKSLKQPPETLQETVWAYLDAGGSSDDLCTLLNDHISSPDFHFSLKVLKNPNHIYSLEFYFYLFTFCKILLDDPVFCYHNGKRQLGVHHYILEKGTLEYPPWLTEGCNKEGYLSLANIRAIFIFVENAFQFNEKVSVECSGRELARQVLKFMNQYVDESCRVDRAFFNKEEILVSFEYLFTITSIFEMLMDTPDLISTAYHFGTLNNHHLAQSIFLMAGKSPCEKMKDWVRRTNAVYDFRFTEKKGSLTIQVNAARIAESGMFGVYEANCFAGIKQAFPAIFSAFMEIAKGKKNRVRLTWNEIETYTFNVRVAWGPSWQFFLKAVCLALTPTILGVYLQGNWNGQIPPLALTWIAAVLIGTGGFLQNRYHSEKVLNEKTKALISTQLNSLQNLTAELMKERDHLNETVQIRTRELQNALEQLKSLDRSKTSFIANVSHELRTPLSLITTPLEELQNGLYGETINRNSPIFELINRNSLRLQRQISQLLEFARLDLTNHQLKTEPIEIIRFCSELVMELHSLAESKGLYLHFHNKTPWKEISIEANKEELETLMMNLIGNALKFTHKGGVEIIIGIKSHSQEITLSVKDTGIGFTEEQKARLFEQFYQVEEKGNYRFQGAGLGLALVKQIVNRHNWAISASADPGRGACLTIVLEISEKQCTSLSGIKRNLSRAQEISSQLSPSDWKEVHQGMEDREKLLLVDDNADMAAVLSDIFGSRYQTEWSKDGESALTKLSRNRDFALIICDMMMPGMSGLDFRKKYLEAHPDDEIPFIFLTALADQKTRDKALVSGGVDYITKPFKARELKQKVDNLIKINRIQYKKALRDAEGMERLIRWNEMASAESMDEFMNLFNITRTEKRVLEQLKNGYQDKEIAENMAISPRTVSTHLRNLYKKTGTQNRVELLKKFYLSQ